MLELNSSHVKAVIEKAKAQWLEKTAEMMVNSVKQNTAVDTGKTRDGWLKIVSTGNDFAIVANPLENAVWEEFGTGEYALSGNGRKGGWVYKGKDGRFHYTRGKQPKRPFQRAYEKNRGEAVLLAEKIFKEVLK
ncbi:MAG: HK97 gp10 family phage protein [Oscillospiraceae bacterium]|nr:HK97 gp10 family phage protein [Oscillospiraceae bacterium]